MHPVLRRNNIQRLPPTIKRVALAACSPNRSLDNLERLSEYMVNASEEQKPCILPVLHFNLDPDDVPIENGFDPYTVSPTTTDAIGRAWSAFRLLRAIEFPQGVGIDLWPRVWRWTWFFHLFHEHLPWVLEASLCFDLLTFAGRFKDHQPSHNLIKSTPGFWVILGRAWVRMTEDVDTLDPHGRNLLFAELSNFLGEPDVGDPTHLAQLIEGVGGSIHDLARTATHYLAAILPTPPAVMDMVCIHSVWHFVSFIRAIDPSLDNLPGDQPLEDVDGDQLALGAFGSALVLHKIIQVLTDTVCAGTRSLRRNQHGHPDEPVYLEEILGHTLVVLSLMVIKSPGDGKLSVALESGLLTALVLGAQIPNTEMTDIIRHWIGTTLPRYLVYYRVVRALGSALEGVADLASTDVFKQAEVYDNWKMFVSVARERIRLLELLASPEFVPVRACDNIACLRIYPKSLLRRCSGCLNLYYCSKPCQIADWREGGHRDTCGEFGVLSLSPERDLFTRERTYLRALVDYDYQKARSTLAYTELLCRHANPEEPYFVVYDYRWPTLRLTAHPLNIRDGLTVFPHVEGVDIVSRIARSSGRMRLDLVLISRGVGDETFIIPLRRNRQSRLDEAVGLLARELPRDQGTWDVDAVKARLDAIIEDPGLVEIH
ncbi:hypothetical protein C8R46DRAFT_1351266 [Mycena filopes]|nr:hypothetical protein C8R46DRAFT_1351266 [Mycena filopes]